MNNLERAKKLLKYAEENYSPDDHRIAYLKNDVLYLEKDTVKETKKRKKK